MNQNHSHGARKFGKIKMNRAINAKTSRPARKVIIIASFLIAVNTPAFAQVPSVNAFYQNIASRRQAIADICTMGSQWNNATGESFYQYLRQRIRESYQRRDYVMVNRYTAEGRIAQRYCQGVF